MPDSPLHLGLPNYKLRIYHVWRKMKQRCNNPNHSTYKYYGGRGIGICARWFLFRNFLEDMGEGKKGWTIERIDNDAGYCVDNCCWATMAHQNRNKTNTVRVELRGFSGCLKDACDHFQVNYDSVKDRIRMGESIENAIFRGDN